MSKKILFGALSKLGVNVERDSDNVIKITGDGKIPVDILLPESFQLEKEAIVQLVEFAHYKNHTGTGVKCACATPDFHKGSTIPVGSVVVTPETMVIPKAIGTDINCGMRMHKTGLGYDEFMAKKPDLMKLLKGDLLEGTRDIPTSATAMQALFNYGLPEFWNEMKKDPKGIFQHVDYERVFAELFKLHDSAFERGNSKYAPVALMNREWMRDPGLGTLGGGNHFCEFQVVTKIVDKQKAYEIGLKVGDVVYMIHTGSRDVGFYIGATWMDKAKDMYPKDMKHPKSGIYAIEGEMAEEYMHAMHSAAHYATANRALIAEIVRQRTQAVYGREDNSLITDVPHNIILREKIGNVHRKGATPAYDNQMLLIPGSMGHDSYLMKGLGNDQWLQSASHGAGRNYSRSDLRYKSKRSYEDLGLDKVECITLKEERKIEEAPAGYKEIGEVIRSQVEENVMSTIAVFSPIVTFKA